MSRIKIDQILTAVESGDYIGICITCGFEQEWVEPDARKYTCEDCGQPEVYGAEELLMMMGILSPNYLENV
jgi:predicted RNA-binding Zn-ribbon protein involved in translation (DUF1610 family)